MHHLSSHSKLNHFVPVNTFYLKYNYIKFQEGSSSILQNTALFKYFIKPNEGFSVTKLDEKTDLVLLICAVITMDKCIILSLKCGWAKSNEDYPAISA